jgi:hypothetical protein
VLEPLLLFGCPLGGRVCFQPLVGNRLSALDREAVGSLGEPPLRPLHRLELALQLLRESLVEIILSEIRRVVGEMVVVLVSQFVVVRRRKPAKRPVDALSLPA